MFSLVLRANIPHVLVRDNRLSRGVMLHIEEQPMKLSLYVGGSVATPFEVSAQPECPSACGFIRERYGPDFRRVSVGDRQSPLRPDSGVSRLEGCLADFMNAGITVVFDLAGLGRQGPEVATFNIREIQELSVAIADHVHFPTGQDVVLRIIKPGKTTTILADNQSVASRTNDVDPRHGRVRIGNPIGAAAIFEMSELVGKL